MPRPVSTRHSPTGIRSPRETSCPPSSSHPTDLRSMVVAISIPCATTRSSAPPGLPMNPVCTTEAPRHGETRQTVCTSVPRCLSGESLPGSWPMSSSKRNRRLPMNLYKVARLALRGGLSPLAARGGLPPPGSWFQFGVTRLTSILPRSPRCEGRSAAGASNTKSPKRPPTPPRLAPRAHTLRRAG